MSRLSITRAGYPEPPADLTPEQREIWRRVVRSKDPEWWDDAALPLLVQYVRAIDLADATYARAMESIAHGDPVESAHWLKMYDAAVRTVRSLASDQRLSQSARKDDKAKMQVMQEPVIKAKPEPPPEPKPLPKPEPPPKPPPPPEPKPPWIVDEMITH